MSLITHSKQIEQKASSLMHESGLLNVLAKYGEVRFTGGYGVHLIYAPDIDIHLVTKNATKENALRLHNDLVGLSFFRGHLFYDFVTHEKHGYPKSYYIGLKVPFADLKWKVDIWLVNEKDDNSKEIIALCSGISETQREKILELKKYKEDKGIRLSGYWVCKAVIEKNITSIDAFDQYLLEEKITYRG